MEKTNYTDRAVIDNFRKSISFIEEQKAFSKVFGDFKCIVLENNTRFENNLVKLKDMYCLGCSVCRGQHICHNEILNAIKRSRTSGKVEKFDCPQNTHGFSYTITQGERIYGYLIGCHVKTEISEALLDVFASFTQTILREMQKEQELKKLYETIRPRAIALSTVHTLHRLISSTLNLNELLPRVARLTLQVMRANRCSIKLVDSKKKNLLPKSTVDLRTKKARLKKVEIGRHAPGRAVKFARAIRGRDFLATPLIDEDVIGVITVYDKIDRKPFSDFDEEIMKTLCEQAVIAIKNAQLYKEQERLTIGSIKSISAMLEAKSHGSYMPKASFLKIVRLVGIELKLSQYDLKCLEYASLLHDAGQITLPDEVTEKKGELTGEEYNLIKEHPEKAAQILRPLKSLKHVVPVILHHHENFDGTGYPDGLKGNQIPLGARIMGVVGAFEAMITERSYRKPLGIEQAIDEIKDHSGKQFDPMVVKAFMIVINRKDVKKILQREAYGHKDGHK